MAISLERYDKIKSRPGRPTTGDDGFALSAGEEAAFDRAWSRVAESRGVKQLPNQPSEAEIKQRA